MLNDIKEIKNWLLEYNLDKNAKYDFISKENHVEVNVLGDVKILKTIKKFHYNLVLWRDLLFVWIMNWNLLRGHLIL